MKTKIPNPTAYLYLRNTCETKMWNNHNEKKTNSEKIYKNILQQQQTRRNNENDQQQTIRKLNILTTDADTLARIIINNVRFRHDHPICSY